MYEVMSLNFNKYELENSENLHNDYSGFDWKITVFSTCECSRICALLVKVKKSSSFCTFPAKTFFYELHY